MWYVILTFSLWVTYYLTKLKTKGKNLQHNSHTIAVSRGAIFAKNTKFLNKNAGISKIKGFLVLSSNFSKTKYVSALTHQFSSF